MGGGVRVIELVVDTATLLRAYELSVTLVGHGMMNGKGVNLTL